MTKRIPQPRSELSPSIRTHEAQLLAVMLRTSRLTWVFGEPGTDTTSLLQHQLLPLLQRRRSDRIDAPAPTPAETPQRERRRRAAGPSTLPRAEVVLYFGSWGGNPLSELKSRLRNLVPNPEWSKIAGEASLSSMLAALTSLLGFDIVILLDRFEELLALSADEGEATQFINQLIDAVLNSKIQASFLIAMSEDARPRLERFRSRIPGFDHNVLRLTPIAQTRGSAPGSPPAADAPHPIVPEPARSVRGAGCPESMSMPPQRRVPPKREPINVNDVYAFIEATLQRTSAQSQNATPKYDAGTATTLAPGGHAEAAPKGLDESDSATQTRAGLSLIKNRRRTT